MLTVSLVVYGLIALAFLVVVYVIHKVREKPRWRFTVDSTPPMTYRARYLVASYDPSYGVRFDVGVFSPDSPEQWRDASYGEALRPDAWLDIPDPPAIQNVPVRPARDHNI